jgi:hypothetical protein
MKRAPLPAARPTLPGLETLATVLLVAVAGASHALLLVPLRRLPDPLFGGDFHYQMGCVRSIAASLDPLASCSTSGALPGYLPLYGTLVAFVSRPLGLDALPAMLIMGVLFGMASVLIVWWVAARFFGPATALVVAALSLALRPEPILRYTEFTAGLVVPVFFLTLCRYLAEPSARRAVALGLVIALTGYAHAVAFIGGIAVFVVSVVIDLATRRTPEFSRRAAAALGPGATGAGPTQVARRLWG